MSPKPTRTAGEPVTEWAPAVGVAVVIHPGGTDETTGLIVEDFGEFTAHSVVVNGEVISEHARRWAVRSDDGMLVFVDSHELGVSAEGDPRS